MRPWSVDSLDGGFCPVSRKAKIKKKNLLALIFHNKKNGSLNFFPNEGFLFASVDPPSRESTDHGLNLQLKATSYVHTHEEPMFLVY